MKKSAYESLKKIFSRSSHLEYLQRILMWDESVMMPKGAGEIRANAMATLNLKIHQMIVNKKTRLLLEAAKSEDLEGWDHANLKWMEKIFLRSSIIPSQLLEKTTIDAIASEQRWRDFRAQNNWLEFLPFLKRNFANQYEIAELKSQKLGVDPYDALLDEYTPGFNRKSIDLVFTELKEVLPNLLNQVIEKQKSRNLNNFAGVFPIQKQEALGKEVVKALGFDFNRGRLDISHHPFCSGGPSDVRITTRYVDHEFLSSLLAVCHESGHGMYEQGLPESWLNQPVGKVESMAMHESQSLLIEMEVCHSRAFVSFLAKKIPTHFNDINLSEENLYLLLNRVLKGLIRVDADEVSYPLHVILRYEIEKDLFDKNMKVDEIPERWDQLMKKYLGLSTIGNDKNGAMQDVHWPAGIFGYFPAYSLGRMMAAQFYSAYKKQNRNWEDEIRNGDFSSQKKWLTENIYKYAASLSTQDLLLKVTQEPLNSSYFIEHIKNRYLAN